MHVFAPRDDGMLAIGVLGAGRLGSALAAALVAAGAGRVAIGARRLDAVRTLASTLKIEAAPPATLVERCDLVFLTVPDTAIESTAETLPWRPGQAAVHCSGALGLDVLRAAAGRKASTGCFHPLQTFPAEGTTSEAPGLFRGITCGVESSDAPLSARLEAIAAGLGARVIRLEGVDRALYHAAAVLVSNDVVALAAAARRVWARAGLPAESGREALAPLLVAAAGNVSRLSPEEALTGPVARGDVATVERHLRALEVEPELREVYRRLALELLQLDLGQVPAVTAELRRVLG
ncbi:MAG: DUF2520 domain-containing protein [Dehalococcoidia bacterium]|nr:MAG: DUF2520 domain-containing protein [Dehalococcoidia bacterium]